jgi:drug/metabolite transporter (DMT)-like permease
VLNSLVPLFSLVIAGVALRTEPVTGLRVGGIVLGFVGAALLATRELELRADASGLVGAGAVVLAALSYAAGASYSRHRIQRTHRYVVAGGTLVFAAVDMWILALVADGGVIVPAQLDTLAGSASSDRSSRTSCSSSSSSAWEPRWPRW